MSTQPERNTTPITYTIIDISDAPETTTTSRWPADITAAVEAGRITIRQANRIVRDKIIEVR